MRHAMEHLESFGTKTMRLEGDPPGIPIYERLGFEHEFVSPRFRLRSAPRPSVDSPAPILTPQWPDIAEFDAPHFGDERKRLLGEIFPRARALYRSPVEGRLKGYLTVQPSAAGARIGPWVATEPEAAEELLQAALFGLEGETVVVALPGVNSAGQELLRQYGFIETPPSFRMIRGPTVARGRPGNVYAIANGALG